MYKAISLPDDIVGMQKLDRSKFITKFKAPVTTIEDSSTVNEHLKKLRAFILKAPKFKPVQSCENGQKIIIDPEKFDESSPPFTEYKWDCEEFEFNYENFHADPILKKILGQEVSGGAGFSVIGHIVHLNLRANVEPYKFLIGEVLLDKLKNIKMVVNKMTSINSTYRNFSFEVLAGTGSTVVKVKENGNSFEFDFAKVYWNPRLATEHERIAAILGKKDTLFDVFAGVGPFAVPAARRGCKVFANDLNPESFQYLEKNIKINKIQANVKAFNLDGREFIRNVLTSEVRKLCPRPRRCRDEEGVLGERQGVTPGSKDDPQGSIHVTMNLPAMAVEFLDVFKELDLNVDLHVHCYCFVKGEVDREGYVQKLVEKHLGEGKFEIFDMHEHFVRSVAPDKDMMRASFILSYGPSDELPPAKRIKEDAD